MNKLVAWLEVEGHRAYAYRIALIAGPLLIAAGVVSSGQVATVLQVLGALLGVGGTGLAVKHTSTKAKGQAGQVVFDVVSVCLIVLTGVVVLWWFGVRP